MTSELTVSGGSAALSFDDSGSFDHIQRVAKMFSDSQLVPVVFQKNVPNCIIALEMSRRMRASVLMVMQNLDIIHGKPSFSSKFNIASVNACGRFSPLRFKMVGSPNTDTWGCYAVAVSREDNQECVGTTVTIAMARAEGWYAKTGSKWKTMPELMLQYRAATFWTRMFAPELLMGFPTQDEVVDIADFNAAGPAAPAGPPRRTKGIAGMRRAEAVPAHGEVGPAENPVPETGNWSAPADATVQDGAQIDATSDAPPPVSEPLPETTTPAAAEPPAETPPPKPPPFKGRCEFVNYTEREGKKKNGVVGPVCTVQLKGDYEGVALFDGPKSALPTLGAVADVTLTDSQMKGQPVKILSGVTVLA